MIKYFNWPILLFIIIANLTGCLPSKRQMFMNIHDSFKIKPVKVTKDDYKIYDSQGNLSNLDDIIEKASKSNVVFIGESHGNAAAHFLEAEILKKLYEAQKNSPEKLSRAVILSMEMFETDVQMILDEYLNNIISERHFLSASRPWPMYMRDYRSMIEFAKEKKIQVIAANAPGRYVNRVSRLGRKSLKDLSSQAKSLLPPLPYAKASEKYQKKLKDFWDKAAQEHKQADEEKKFQNFVDAQSLWDASMAFSIAQKLKKIKNALIININGLFHSNQGLGIPEHLKSYMPDVKILIISVLHDDKFPNLNDKLKKYGDFVIITKG